MIISFVDPIKKLMKLNRLFIFCVAHCIGLSIEYFEVSHWLFYFSRQPFYWPIWWNNRRVYQSLDFIRMIISLVDLIKKLLRLNRLFIFCIAHFVVLSIEYFEVSYYFIFYINHFIGPFDETIKEFIDHWTLSWRSSHWLIQ